jgi:DNA repair protein RadC
MMKATTSVKATVKKLISNGEYSLAIDKLMELSEPILPAIKGPSEIAEVLQKKFGFKTKEHFFVVMLNGNNQVTEIETISIGLLNRTVVHPREVFREAVMANCASIIVGHNHPSGNLTPSSDDISVNNRLIEAGKILGIEVLDHIIVGRGGYTSFIENGNM